MRSVLVAVVDVDDDECFGLVAYGRPDGGAEDLEAFVAGDLVEGSDDLAAAMADRGS